MILLNDIAKKIQGILNGSDEWNEIPSGVNLPVDFKFVVKTAGFHLDTISDKKTWKNFIPVFVNSLGGQFNPVPELQEKTQSVGITFYFPVRFKNDMDSLCDYLARCFVGKYLTYYKIGNVSHKAISNLSVPQYNEIQEIDLNQFKNWISENYSREINITEPYYSLSMTLYVKDAATDFVYGNAATVSLTVTVGSQNYFDSNVVFAEGSIQSNSEPASQQLLGATTPESDGLPANTSYSSGFTIYYKSNSVYKWIVSQWFSGNQQNIQCSLTISFDTNSFTRTCYLQSVNMPLRKGELVTLTFTFAKKKAVS